MMNIKELREKNPQQLLEELKEVSQEAFKLRMQPNVAPHNIKNARKQIARIKTILNEKKREMNEREK